MTIDIFSIFSCSLAIDSMVCCWMMNNKFFPFLFCYKNESITRNHGTISFFSVAEVSMFFFTPSRFEEEERKSNHCGNRSTRPFPFTPVPSDIKNISITIFLDFEAYSRSDYSRKYWGDECERTTSTMSHHSRYQKSYETFFMFLSYMRMYLSNCLKFCFRIGKGEA